MFIKLTVGSVGSSCVRRLHILTLDMYFACVELDAILQWISVLSPKELAECTRSDIRLGRVFSFVCEYEMFI